MPHPAVDVNDLVMRYGDVTAVDGLSLRVETGTITAILGPNGAGKTTTIETCEGFRRPQEGTVRVLGRDPVADATELRPRVGVMLQSGGAWLGVRAEEMLRHMASLHAHPLDVDALMERLGIGSFARTAYRRLSGGQKQRLSLAMAMVGRPELLFLDEPSAGLDPQSRRATWDLLVELREQGVTTVLTTHFMDEAEELSDAVYIVDSGRVIAAGTPRELTGADARNTLHVVAPAGLDAHALADWLPAGTTADEPVPGQYVVTGDITPSLVARVTAWFGEHEVLVESVLVERRSLEDRFLDLTGKALR